MRLLITSIAAFSAVAAPAQAASLSPNDRIALEQLKDANDAAWNRRDAKTITGQYVAGATVRVAPSAELVEGRKTINRFFTAAFDRRVGEFRHVTSLAHLEPLDDDTVLTEGDVRVERQEANGAWSLVRQFRTISVAVREKESWKLRSVRAIPLPAPTL